MKDWLRNNWKFITQIVALIGAIVGANAAMAPAPQPERPPDVWVVMDTAGPAPALVPVQADPVQAGEWILVAKIAIAVAIKILEVRAPKTPGDFDDRLLALLKLFASDRGAFEAAEAAAMRRAAGGG